MNAAVPEQLGPYTIEREIGRGGMGVVYLGRDTKLDRPVAIKALPEHLAEDPDRLARFEREARTLAQLSHPNVAGIYGVEQQDGARYLVLEFVEGETLGERLDRGALPVDEALDVCTQIASGVEAAHDAGVVHRDLKPANIKLTPDGRVKVLDFGLAKSSEGHSTSSSGFSQVQTVTSPGIANSPTVPGVILGTAPYMSPEQARGRTVDKRSDIWSFGVLLYECLTGAGPFIGETATDSIGAILHKDVDLSRLPAGTPAQVRRVLKRCLERDKSLRYRDIGDARLDLSASVDEGPSSRARMGMGAIAGVLGAGLAIGAGAVWFGAGAGPVEPERAQIRFNIGAPAGGMIADDSFLCAFDIAPDGQSIVFVGERDGVRRLYVRAFDELDARELADTIGAEGPRFSPDGRSVAFAADTKIKRIGIEGGPSREVCDAASPRGLSWVNEDLLVFTPAQLAVIMTVPASGGQPSVLTEFEDGDVEYSHRHPEALPDGDTVLFSRANFRDWDQLEVWAVSLSTRETRRIFTGAAQVRYSPSGHLVYVSGGALMAQAFDIETLETTGSPRSLPFRITNQQNTGATQFTVGPDGTLAMIRGGSIGVDSELVTVSLDGSATALSEERRAYRVPRLSPDASSVLTIAVEQGRGDMYTLDLETGGLARQTFRGSTMGIWSADGGSVIYANADTGNYEFRRRPADGGIDERMMDNLPGVPLALCHRDDPELLLFSSFRTDSIERLMIAEPESDQWRVRPLIESDANTRGGALSPDGRWLAYVSDELDRMDVFVTEFPGCTRKWHLSPDGGSEPAWSRDGSTLYFRNGQTMLKTEVSPGETFRASQPEALFTTWYEGLVGAGLANYDVLPDGQGFVMVRPVRDGSREARISVLPGWADSLETRD